MKLMTTMSFLATVCLSVGCAEDTSAPPATEPEKPADPVIEALGFLDAEAACSDGTIYVADAFSGKVVWLVNGEAVIITLDDKTEDFLSFKLISDFNGGVYVVGENRLWYIKSGVAKPVSPVSVSAISPDEHKVTAQSANWAALITYGREQFDEGYEAGREAEKEEAWSGYPEE
ncbi:MAG: hypothetical protein WBD63_05735 [Phycisphaerae bacterium]|nr:hypothetical protein [Phycisphaerae bacterium]